MIRMSKLTDYGIQLLARLAASEKPGPHTARELAAEAQLPLPVVSKLLKALAREGLLASHRGARGGYTLARRPETLSVAEVIGILEGPIALTECGAHPGQCTQEADCNLREPWQRINALIQYALARVSLADLVHGLVPAAAMGAGAPPTVALPTASATPGAPACGDDR